MFNEGRENVHDEARIGRPSLVNADLVRKVNERVRDDRRFTISDLSLLSPLTSAARNPIPFNMPPKKFFDLVHRH